ncbi:hypothetical protein DFH29DRAFT_965425 [Suillus ampliporus]|nr:hypothetical protein DFH29DRAFT_965425 [Suillus ampliporus]
MKMEMSAYAHQGKAESHEPSFIAETSFVRAPLNLRVGASASIHKAKGKTKEDVLDHLPVDIQKALILEDILYVLTVRLCKLSLCSKCVRPVFYISWGRPAT